MGPQPRMVPIGRMLIPNWTLLYSQIDVAIFPVRPWSRNELSRLVKAAKLHFIDSGLLTAMRGYSSARLRSDRTLLGPLLETFVFSELLKAAGWAEERISIFHYRE